MRAKNSIIYGLVVLAMSTSARANSRATVINDYETIRLFTSKSKPERIATSAVSPDGRFLALSFDHRSNDGSADGVSIVDLHKMELLGRFGGSFSFSSIAFSTDSTKVLGLGGYAGIVQVDLRTGKYREVDRSPWGSDSRQKIVSHLGIGLRRRNGKLVIAALNKQLNPTLGDELETGDELLSFNDGEKSTRYDDSREWRSLVGKSEREAISLLCGLPRTWVQLRFQKSGSLTPTEVTVQRQTITAVTPIPKSNGMAVARLGADIHFYSAATGDRCAAVKLRDTGKDAQWSVSPDGNYYGRVAKVIGGEDVCLEVYSLHAGKAVASGILDSTDHAHLQFSPDSRYVLVGTRDTVEVFNVAKSVWQSPISLTPDEQRDPGRTVNRTYGGGFLSGGFSFSVPSVVYSKPAALTRFDVLPKGNIVVGSQAGRLSLVDAKSGKRMGEFGDQLLGTEAELVQVSPTGEHIVAYAKGILHVLKLSKAGKNSLLRMETESSSKSSSVVTTVRH